MFILLVCWEGGFVGCRYIKCNELEKELFQKRKGNDGDAVQCPYSCWVYTIYDVYDLFIVRK